MFPNLALLLVGLAGRLVRRERKWIVKALALIASALTLGIAAGPTVVDAPSPDPTDHGIRPKKTRAPAPITARPLMRKAKAQAYGARGSRSKEERQRRRATRRARAKTVAAR
jgi:hypothetical protein